jgi:acylphosphatase
MFAISVARFYDLSAMKARKLFYNGHVQGVGFRYAVKQIASGYDVNGYVRNLPDGRVELLLQGLPDELSAMEGEIVRSHLNGLIRTVESFDVAVDLELRGFSILP